MREPADEHRDWHDAAARAAIGPLRAELESHRVASLYWQERAASLEAALIEERRRAAPRPRANVVGRAARRFGLHPRASVAIPVVPDDLDLEYYRERYSDLGSLDDEQLVMHFEKFGRAEGRTGKSPAGDVGAVPSAANHERPIILIASASPDGDPAADIVTVLAQRLRRSYDVVLILEQESNVPTSLTAAATATFPLPRSVYRDEFEAGRFGTELLRSFTPRFAVLCGSASRGFAEVLEDEGVPVVMLLQEFAEDVEPRGELANLVGTASSIVFPSRAAAASALREHAFMKGRDLSIVRQGRVPIAGQRSTSRQDDAIIVLGAGTWTPRAGVELFLEAARRSTSARPTRFVWVGPEDPAHREYADVLRAQARQPDLAEVFEHVPDASRLVEFLGVADIYLDTSRITAVPTASLEAGWRGIPVIAFAQSGAIPEVLADRGLGYLIAKVADARSAATIVDRLIEDDAERGAAGRLTSEAFRDEFDEDRFAAAIEHLGTSAVERAEQIASDVDYLVREELFDPNFYWGTRDGRPDDREAARHYLRMSRLAIPRSRPYAGLTLRRGLEGFHPLIWAEEHPTDDTEPVVAWGRAGRPSGRWTHEVIKAAPDDRERAGASGLGVLVHAHFYYPEGLSDLLDRLNLCGFDWQLIVTTDTANKADHMREVLREHAVDNARVIAVPNRGRDLGPLLSAIDKETLEGAELLLHIHGKKSAHTGGSAGDEWRRFLWGSLVATAEGFPAAGDAIVRAFAESPPLGVVFAEDPNAHDWDDNRGIAEALSPRLGIPLPLPTHFDFPQGGMFWARIPAIRELWTLGLTWEDYPDEPVPVDGTVLHTVERILPFVAAARGFGYATSVAAGVGR